ncbi:TPA: cytochrome c-550 PedF [Pseudomonas putida]|uniref:Cytochrome c class I n=1 Tax=Pseudomonas putida (strain GB-1) TaxID=76869 RepID=B0KGL9_PSEPG|nr:MULTISPECIES: cytochrome c-550 PedF [Pseudomonas]ABY99020.1 cytochrome c class I [Pseudomonas putida GB-1]APE99255.1 cytochrome c-550 PedF [Pseudomonas putida]MBP0708771.1 cytochrome c-550 PedF [Pseudomonas sp. T34]MCE1000995.1 cytochrome c-550 PedF [Pseudomonas sp. NMI1173_11]MCK2188209.1 cytochrome c-550 PedF [Pseudomonas sp. MB04B]
MTKKRDVLLAAGLLAGAVLTGTAWAHGNVVPQAVETKGLTPIKDAGVSLDGDGWAAVNPYRSSPEHDKAVEIGASAYNQNCAACHGLEAKSGGIAPDLRMLDAGDAGDEWFVERVRHGAVRDGRVYMPKMADYLSQEALWAVRTYLDSVHVEE